MSERLTNDQLRGLADHADREIVRELASETLALREALELAWLHPESYIPNSVINRCNFNKLLAPDSATNGERG